MCLASGGSGKGRIQLSQVSWHFCSFDADDACHCCHCPVSPSFSQSESATCLMLALYLLKMDECSSWLAVGGIPLFSGRLRCVTITGLTGSSGRTRWSGPEGGKRARARERRDLNSSSSYLERAFSLGRTANTASTQSLIKTC